MARAESKASTSEVSFQEDFEGSAKHLSDTKMNGKRAAINPVNPTLHCVTAKDGDGDGEDVGLGLQGAAQQ